MSFDKIAITNEDSQFLETRQMQTQEICRIFRVPPYKVADYGRATWNNVEQQQRRMSTTRSGRRPSSLKG